MEPHISICRKRENLYLKLKGNLNQNSCEEILCTVKKLLLTSLQFSSPEAQVFFTFRTRAKVDLAREKRG